MCIRDREEGADGRKRAAVQEGEGRGGRRVPLYLQERMIGLCRVTRERTRMRREGGWKRRREVLRKGLPRVMIRVARWRGREMGRRRMVGEEEEQEQKQERVQEQEEIEQGRMVKRMKRNETILEEHKVERMEEEQEEEDQEEEEKEEEERKGLTEKEIEKAKKNDEMCEKRRKEEDDEQKEQEEQEEEKVAEVIRVVVEGNVLTRLVFEELVAYMRCPWDPVVAEWVGGYDGRKGTKDGG